MADSNIAGLSAGAAIVDGDLFAGSDNGGTALVKKTAAQLKSYMFPNPFVVTSDVRFDGGNVFTVGSSSINFQFYVDGNHVWNSAAADVGWASGNNINGSAIDTRLYRDDVGVVRVNGNGATSPGALQLYSYGASPPAAPAALGARLYADTSGGKIRLMVIFPSGASQQIAIEP